MSEMETAEAHGFKLEDLLPSKPEFKLSKTGKTYSLRPMNLQDRIDMQAMFGGPEKVAEVFNKKDWFGIARMAYKLMEDKSDFLAGEGAYVDDEGFRKNKMFTGPEKFFNSITGVTEMLQVMGAVTASATAGEPIMAEYLKDELKKKLKEPLTQLTGQQSLTPSPQSTATPPSNSDNSPTGMSA